MKKPLHLTLSIVLSAAIIGGSLVFAEQGTKTAQLTYKNITVYMDGQLVDTTGAEPFIYNGTTYLPIRAVAEAVGKEVNFVGETNTVYLGAMPSAFVETDTLIEDMYSYNSTFERTEYVKKGADNLSNSYSSGKLFFCSNNSYENENSTEYSLNGKYKSLKGTIALPYVDRNNANEKTVTIYGDGKVLYKSDIFTKESIPEKIDIDLSDVAVLKIEIKGSGVIGFFDTIFYAK